MNVSYNNKTNCLYIRVASRKQTLENRRITNDIVFDIGKDGKTVGIEILDASEVVNISQLLPIECTHQKAE